MQKWRCDARTSRFKALHGSARYFQGKLQAIRNLARRGDSLQLLEAVDAASWRGKLSFTSFFKQAGWLRRSQVHYDDGRSWQKLARRNDALSRIPRWIDWVLKEMKITLYSFRIFWCPSGFVARFRPSTREFRQLLMTLSSANFEFGKARSSVLHSLLEKLRSF